MWTCRLSHNVCSARLYAPGAGSYIVRVSSHFLPVSAANRLYVYTTNSPQIRRMPRRFLFARHLTTRLSSSTLKKINIRNRRTGVNPRSPDNMHRIFNEVARCIRVSLARLGRLRRSK